MLYGFTGKILHVDLTNRRLEIEEPSADFYRHYLGGSLMGLYYLWQNTPAGADPLSPENTLTFAVGPATGLPISGQSRCTVTCKSPSSGGAADSQAGGFWPAELKYAGFDAVVVKGASDTPVYLWIHEGEAELRDASHLWGKYTYDVDTILKDELADNKIEIAQIGVAGEKMANFAAIINMSNRAWGRTGTGAVMGSKKLKAIVVRGTRKVEPANKKAVVALNRKGAKAYPGSDMEEFGKYGTPGVVMPQHGGGGLPTRNWDAGAFEAAEAISGERLYDEILRGANEGKQDKQGRDTCYACIVRCKRVVASEWQSKMLGKVELRHEYGGPEYETIATFGSYCGIDDLHAVVYANQLCNQYGVDTISCGATLSWAMECFENEVLSIEETDGIELRYGNAEGMIAMLEKTLNREGFGDVLADGSAKAADRLGKGHEYLLTIKGQELPAHMPQVKRSLGLIYAVNPFGADHQSSEHDPMYNPKVYANDPNKFLAQIGLDKPQPTKALNAEKVEFALKTQYNYSAMDTISICQFVYGPGWQLSGPNDMAELMTAATGWDVSVAEIQEIGRRRLNLMRAYNAREGLQRDNDTLPKKLYKKALAGGRSDGIVMDEAEIEAGMDMYFEQAGWDVASGVPTRAALEDAGLAWVADDMGL
ncbi:MAG: aldehyde ferredoxin oxidoreductase family protein [Ardenticatenaceae bacterium]|nr:aldehyde ferredoxin oxidoreductase family protein [Ardenticatenaceae bacterium]